MYGRRGILPARPARAKGGFSHPPSSSVISFREAVEGSVAIKKSTRKAVPASWATEKLTPEDEAELHITVRVAHDLLEFLGAPRGLASFVAALTERMVGSALCRAKPNRRAAHLD